jgi:hypothetical protein
MCSAENLALAASSLGVLSLTIKKQMMMMIIIIITITGTSLPFKLLTSYNLNYLTNHLSPLHSTEGFLRRFLYMLEEKH